MPQKPSPVHLDGQPDLDATAALAAKKERKTAIATVIGSLVFAFLMVIMTTSVYLATMHAPSPHDMPVAVIGSGELAQDVVFGLERAENSPASIRIVDTTDEALQLLHDREIAGAIELPGNDSADTTAVIHTASAAGASQASVVQQILAPVAIDAGMDIQVDELTPLPAGDSAGIAAMFMAMALMLAGYMPIGLVLTGAPELLKLRRFVPVWVGWSALISALVWFIAGPVIGSFSGHTAAILGIGWLTVFSIGLVQLFLSRILGAAAVLVGMLLVVVLGMPASNLAMSVHTMPGFFGWLHGILPLPGAGEALRSVLYFGGAGALGYLVRFVVAIVLALLATAGVDALRRRKQAKALLAAASETTDDAGNTAITGQADAAAPVAASAAVAAASPRAARLVPLAGGKPRSRPVRYLMLAAFPFSMVALMLGLMLTAMHSPTPVGLPVAIVSSTEGAAQQFADGLAGGTGDMLALSTQDSAQAASDLVYSGELVGALVLPDAAHPSATLYSAGAAGTGQQMVLQRVFQQAAQQAGVELEQVDVAPLTASDTGGSVSLYISMGWVMAGFLGITVLTGGAPWALRLRKQLPTLLGWSAFMSVTIWLIAGPLVGAYHGPVWSLLGIGVLTIASLGLVTAAISRVMGLLAVVPVVTVFMFVGVPASGGGLSTYMQPGLFQTLHDVLPLPAALDAVRGITYYGGAGVGPALLTLVAWGMCGLAANLVISAVQKRRAQR
ncbi:ABC transporter permease [Microterricola viridarii]|uniref:ABC-2 family transporter protein n=1 Tax=Microterricola viridarii TaxID=412690 RepID=A0A1H1LVY5_9MICO|nr:hypothetical protein [Microterricola viridarii]SDR78412.1 hypothetical protein SAMN04489834_0228 [Microterricola viridarii]